ncbi:MAG TPA: FAD-dependent oxidoreductase [Solirubrobacteraceae bacterium]|nr:FAD-dependent oxidoreductase [Solirubrobacteraceae bacterium]
MNGARSETDGPTKIAILGGGCGGLAAAWALTATPALRERFEVTVYERSWALGGKGASGRMPDSWGNGGRGQRIHEHGLHIWFGFYVHAFRMLRGAYEESGLASGDDWWKLPFQKCDEVSLYEQRDDGTWLRQSVRLPRRGGANRGPPTQPQRLAMGRVMARTTRLLATGLRAELGMAEPRRRGGAGSSANAEVDEAASALEAIAAEMDSIESPVLLGADAPTVATRGRTQVLQAVRRPVVTDALQRLVGELQQNVNQLQVQVTGATTSDRVRLWRGVLELVAASLAGMVRDDVLWRGFDALDEEDFREWLGRHGAGETTLARSPVLRGLYDLTFAYREGDKRRPSLAAGKGLQSLLMMINYEGSFMWRMRAGMGDVVFAPLYLALARRGVRFHFFSEVTKLRLMPGRPVVDAIELTRRAMAASGTDAYDPIERIGEWWCWPADPYLAQLTDDPPTHETLVRGSDFDDVVLAIPLGGLEDICGELAGANPRFKLMLDRGETVRTKALQLWLTKPIDELRSPAGSDGLDPPATAYVEPFDTYCDMSHLLEAEGYARGEGPRGVAYFCAVLADDAEESAVREGALRYLERDAATIWPGAVRDGAFDWGVLFDPHDRAGRDRLGAQYFRANLAGSDRYVTTPAGSVDARLDPDQSGFDNLVLAGDWTHNGIDGGCVEAAVISGERAAEALIGRRPRDGRAVGLRRYVDYGALATAPGPLLCERARLYCFLLSTDRARVQQLCDRVLKEPTGGALRYMVPRLAPVMLTFGTIAGLRSLHPDHSGRGSASEPEAAIWVPTIAQRYEGGRYVDEHMAIFMPYLWVDDPIAFASGREVYGFAKTQGWMPRLGDPRGAADGRPPDPPESLMLDVYGAAEYGPGSELQRHRLLTIRRRPARRGAADSGPETAAEGDDLASLIAHFVSELDPTVELEPARRSLDAVRVPLRAARARGAALADLLSGQVVRHVFLKQIRDAEHGELAALQQVVEARSSVLPGSSLRWRRLRGTYELSIDQLASHPLADDLGLASAHTVSRAFAAEFGFRMEPGVIRWP